MTNPYDSINLDPPRKDKVFVALPTGKYGNSKTPALKIVNYNGARATKDEELTQHSFLVAALDNDHDGQTSFLTLQFKSWWLSPEAVSIAFNDGQPLDGANPKQLEQMVTLLTEKAANQARENNTPKDELQTATQTIFDKYTTRIKVEVGNLFRLKDWQGTPRSVTFDPASLVGTEFAGAIKEGFGGGNTTEVGSIYSRKKVSEVAVP